MNHVYPTDYNDAVTLVHDIEYLIYVNSYFKTLHSDLTAIINSEGLESIPIKLGLTLRAVSGIRFNSDSGQDDHRVGLFLKNYILTDHLWSQELSKYNLKWTD